jgi:hypothetical protein
MYNYNSEKQTKLTYFSFKKSLILQKNHRIKRKGMYLIKILLSENMLVQVKPQEKTR